MQIRKVLTAAGLTIAMGAFAPCVFAQAGAGGVGGAATGGVPVTSGSGNTITGQAPSAGAPGTQAPASAAPVGSASSDYMAHEGANGPENSSMSGPAATNSETHARWLETKAERDIVAARSQGMNVAKAQHQKWLGSEALSKGDRPGAIRHFERAEMICVQKATASAAIACNTTIPAPISTRTKPAKTQTRQICTRIRVQTLPTRVTRSEPLVISWSSALINTLIDERLLTKRAQRIYSRPVSHSSTTKNFGYFSVRLMSDNCAICSAVQLKCWSSSGSTSSTAGFRTSRIFESLLRRARWESSCQSA